MNNPLRTTFNFLSLTLLVLIAVSGPLTAAETNARSKARLSITAKQLQTHIEILADDTFEGREAGSRGGQAAAVYLVKQFQQIGLAGGAEEGKFYQTFAKNSRNILALLPGSDPKLKDEVIVVGAHYDHVGYGKRNNSYGPLGYIHNGADDNASGVAGLLELAEALKQLPSAPKRTILIALWDGEEQGMHGSKHWVKEPTVPLKQVKFMINVDMIGRLRENQLEIIGTRTSRGLRKWLSEQNSAAQLNFKFLWALKADSDHHTFFKQQIPVLMLHTGLHDNYHRPSDDADKINSAGLEQISRYLFTLTMDLSNRDQVTAFREQSAQESKKDRKRFEAALDTPRPRLGVSWTDHDSESGAIIVSRVRYKSPADTAGLKVQDRLLRFNGQAITDDGHFIKLVSEVSRQAAITITREGEEEPLTLPVTFPDQASPLGMIWRSDPAEPESVTLIHVAEDSPAEEAGLQVGDRLLQLGDHSVRESSELEIFLQSVSQDLQVQYERKGQIKKLQITVPPKKKAG